MVHIWNKRSTVELTKVWNGWVDNALRSVVTSLEGWIEDFGGRPDMFYSESLMRNGRREVLIVLELGL